MNGIVPVIQKVIITTLIILIILIAGALLLSVRPTANTSRTSYAGLSLGDHESKVMQVANSSDYFLTGIAEKTDTGGVWELHWVQGGPITKQLTQADLRQNNFWKNLGWTYPVHPLTHHVIVMGERGGAGHGMIYLYMDEAEEVVAIYVGGT